MSIATTFSRFSLVNTTSKPNISLKTITKPRSNKTFANRRQFSSSSENASGKSFFEWYEHHLQTSPLRTKMITGGILWGIGDVVAQAVPTLVAKDEDKTKSFDYDLARTGRAVFFGFAIHAPTAHVHYNFLETLTIRLNISKENSMYVPVFKAFMEQFVYWSWLSNTLYHGAMGAMQGMSMQEIYQRICDVLWETQKAQWVFWIPVQIVNFRYVPVRHQLNVVLITSVIWTAFLSFAFPPVVDDDKDEDKKKEI